MPNLPKVYEKKRDDKMRSHKDLPKCGLRFDNKCMHNTKRCGNNEAVLKEGKYGRMYWGWRVFPFFSPMDCWDKIRSPKFKVIRFKGGTPEKRITKPSSCPKCWALDKDDGYIYKYKERHIGNSIEYTRTR